MEGGACPLISYGSNLNTYVLSTYSVTGPRLHSVGAPFSFRFRRQRANQEGTWELPTLADSCLFLGPDRGLAQEAWGMPTPARRCERLQCSLWQLRGELDVLSDIKNAALSDNLLRPFS